MNREYYSDTIPAFLTTSREAILGRLTQNSDFPVEPTQRDAWAEEIGILQLALKPYQGAVYFEYSVPRMGEKIDVVALIGPAIFVLEFKVGERHFAASAIDQVWDYALDLSNFHETSHGRLIAPILIATEARTAAIIVAQTGHGDGVLAPIRSTAGTLSQAIEQVLEVA